MSAVIESTDPVARLYITAEALRHLAATLPIEQGGLAHMLGSLAKDVRDFTAVIDDDLPPKADE
jgi:hypothetical protein